jgi:hypothetical protein
MIFRGIFRGRFRGMAETEKPHRSDRPVRFAKPDL